MMRYYLISFMLLLLGGSFTASPIFAQQNPSVQVTSATGFAGEQATIQIVVNQPKNVKAIELKLRYDPDKLSLANGKVSKGTAFSTNWSYLSHVEEDIGRVNIVAVSTKGLTDNRQAVLAIMQFQIKDTAQSGDTDLAIEHLKGFLEVSVPAEMSQADGMVKIKAKTNPGAGNPPVEVEPGIVLDDTTVTLTQDAVVMNGTASTVLSKDAAKKLIDVLKEGIEAANGKGGNPVIEIKITVKPGDAVTKTHVTMPKDAVQEMAQIKDIQVSFDTPLAQVVFDRKALEAIADQATSEVTLVVEQPNLDTVLELMSPGQQKKVKDMLEGRPLYSFSLLSGTESITDFQGGKATITVPYTLKPDEKPSHIVVYYVDHNGSLQVEQGKYDADTKSVTMRLKHFSTYAVGYNEASFVDVKESDWYYDAVSFISARNMTGGVGDNRFAPDMIVTRGQFIKMLSDAYRIAPRTVGDNFEDAGDTWYSGYLAAAKQLKLASGVGNNHFAPEQEITRQEMFTLLFNALQVLDEWPAGQGKSVTVFTDYNEIAPWAMEAVAYMTENGIISGNAGMIHPTETATRAEMVQLFYNLLSR